MRVPFFETMETMETPPYPGIHTATLHLQYISALLNKHDHISFEHVVGAVLAFRLLYVKSYADLDFLPCGKGRRNLRKVPLFCLFSCGFQIY